MNLFKRLQKDEQVEVLNDNTLYKVITGSTAYGLNTEESDVDIKAFVTLPKKYLFSLGEEWETTSFQDPDIEYHSLKKGISLLSSQNPTILEMLYVEDEFVLKQNRLGKLLRDNRDLFLSKNCYYSFGGYAKQQLMRIKNGMDKATLKDKNEHLEYTLNRMIDLFPSKYPDLSDGELNLLNVFYNEKDKQDVKVNCHFSNVSLTQLHGMISELDGVTKTYNKINNRNRKPLGKLEKHAMHLARLQLSGITALEEGYIPVLQDKHKPMLMNLRFGEFKWDDFFTLVDDLSDKLDKAFKNTDLPDKIDNNKVNNLYRELMLSKY